MEGGEGGEPGSRNVTVLHQYETNKADGGQIVGDVPVFDAITSDHGGRLS